MMIGMAWILYLVLFGPLLERATQASGAEGSAFNWFVPGLMVQTAMFGAAFVNLGDVLGDSRHRCDRLAANGQRPGGNPCAELHHRT